MKNLFDIKCPACGTADELYVEVGEGGDIVCVDLGRWPDEEAEQVASELGMSIWWHTVIYCDGCGHEGPCETFDGEFPAWMRKIKTVLGRLDEAGILRIRRN